MPLVRKPARSLAKRVFRRTAGRIKQRSNFFAMRMRRKSIRNWLGRRLAEAEAIAEKGKGRKREIPDLDLHGVKLWPPTELDIEALQNRRVPGKLAHLAKQMQPRQIQRLMELLWKYYTQGMTAKSGEWIELKHMLISASKGAATAKRSLRGKGNLVYANRSRAPFAFKRTK